MNGWMGGWIDLRMNAVVGVGMDGWMNGGVDGWLDGLDEYL